MLRDVAIRHLVTVAPGSSLRRAAKVMCDRGVGCAVVIDKEAVAGIITERDLLHAVAEDKVMDDALVEDVMTPDVVSGAPGWDVLKAVNTMVEGGFRHLLITELPGGVSGWALSLLLRRRLRHMQRSVLDNLERTLATGRPAD